MPFSFISYTQQLLFTRCNTAGKMYTRVAAAAVKPAVLFATEQSLVVMFPPNLVPKILHFEWLMDHHV